MAPVADVTGQARPDNAAAFSRWLVSQSSWGVLNTISSDWGGAPFGMWFHLAMAYRTKEKVFPYFYLTALDPTVSNALKDQRSSFTISEYNLGTCGKKDPENPVVLRLRS
ncbi:UNVERIFIED_CONTAM: hypothetical protein Scaly_2101800 [Sesamum calycinum]|uniref:CREG-like beta-barrel domain-containing protein n=1 Tax=Sesamum calycinum TaxID=2727403 RepID=A0AAW2MN88_9LAMI